MMLMTTKEVSKKWNSTDNQLDEEWTYAAVNIE